MSKEATTLRLYPRGFLGADIKPQVQKTPKPFSDNVQRQTYHVEDFKSVNKDLFANAAVEALYASYIKRSATTGDFLFREAILSAVFAALGTKNFEFWFMAQFKSPACGDLHNRFLTDTLRFIAEGNREMSLETWSSLLVITGESDPVGHMNEYAKNFFGMNSNMYGQGRQNTQLTDVVQKWCGHPNGMEDMLGTLHLLFGNP